MNVSPLAESNSALRQIPAWVFSAAAALFLFLSYSPLHYWDEYFYLYSIRFFTLSELLAMEPELGQGLFPQAYFSFKIVFVAAVSLLDTIVASSHYSLYILQFFFALHVLLFCWGTHSLVSLLYGRKYGGYVALITLFLPLSLYFSFKVLSELFSLSLAVFGCVAYLRSIRSGHIIHTRWLMVASFFLCLAVLSRFTTIVFFGGLVASLFLVGDPRYPRMRLVYSSLITIILVSLLSLFTYRFLIGLSFDEIQALFGAVTVRTHGVAVKIYSIGASIQLFALLIVAGAIFRYSSKRFNFALLWLTICAVPFIILFEYVEPRYFYMIIIPMAMLVYEGIRGISHVLPNTSVVDQRGMFFLLLLLIVMGNQVLFKGLMTYELDQDDYIEFIEKIEMEYPDASVIVPWISDYSLLRYRYPEKSVHLSWSPPYGSHHTFFDNEHFVLWAGGKDYVNSIDRLKKLQKPIIYVGWRYNQVAVNLKSKMLWLKNQYVDTVEVHEGLKNHLEQSWMWKHPDLTFVPLASFGMYEAFTVESELF